VNLIPTGSITASRLNTTNISGNGYAKDNFPIYANTYVNGPGINLTDLSLEFSDSYTQTGGYINFTYTSDYPTTLISAKGDVSLSSVTILGYLPLVLKKFIIIQSDSKSIHLNSTSFFNTAMQSDASVQLILKDGQLYLERPFHKESASNFFSHNVIYFIIVGIIVMSFLVVIVFVFVFSRRKKSSYTEIN